MDASIKTYRFTEFTLNPAKRTLFRENAEIKLRDKDFEILLFLVENAPKTCSPDEIIEAVWNGTSVENNSIEKAIANLRNALGDNAKSPRFIRTVRAKGYLFVGDVQKALEKASKETISNVKTEGGEDSRLVQNKTLNLKTYFLYLGIILIIGLLGIIWWKGGEIWARYNSTVIFADDFSSSEIDPNHWVTSGSSVTIANGIMRVAVDETDNGGKLVSSNFSFEPTKPIIIQSRMKVTYNQMIKEKVYFYGSFLITANVYDAKEDFSHESPVDKYGRGVSFTNNDYINNGSNSGNGVEVIPAEGFFLVKPFGRPYEKRSYYDNKVGPRMLPVWAKWFEQKIIYNPVNGVMQYFIDGEKKSEYNVGTMPEMKNPQMRLYISPDGWWTNHSIEIDYIEITQ